MMLSWMFVMLLAGKLSTASPAGEETVAGDSNLGSSGYMMAFNMDDDQVAEESQVAQAAVKILADTLAADDDDQKDDQEEASNGAETVEEKKEEQVVTEQPEPMGILQAELAAEDAAEKASLPQRPFFKRPKIEELRKILGFPPAETTKAKPIPVEKPKVPQSIFAKPLRPKDEPQPLKFEPQPSPLGGIQFNLRREDIMRPFGFPILKRDDGLRSLVVLPDLVQAASSLIRRAIVDDEPNENDISKDDKDEEADNDPNDNDDDDEEEDDSLMIVPIPDSKEANPERPPLFRRLPMPFPFPKQMQPQGRPRLPFSPLTPVAFFLPIAQQIMQNIRQSQPRSQPPMMPQHAPNLIPVQAQLPIIPIHHPIQQQFVHAPMHQQVLPFIPLPQGSAHIPIMAPLPNMQQRSMVPRQMPRRMPLQPQRRIPLPPMSRSSQPVHFPLPQQHFIAPMLQRPTRPIPQVVRPPMPPLHPVLIMLPVPNAPMQFPIPQSSHQFPVFAPRPQPVMHHMPMFPMASQPRQVFHPVPEEDRVILLPPEHHMGPHEDPEDDQEVLLLVPSDEMEVAQRPPMARHLPSPLQRIRLLRDLLMARQSQRQPPPQSRASRVVEIVQQQLRIFPTQHMQVAPEPSELHPVYVPYPGPQ